jgi:RNA recognition motif-containing protein
LDETKFREIFGRYGEIKSVKIPTTVTCTKIKGEFVDLITSCGFGFVCYTNADSARKAFSEMNNELLKEFPDSKRPLVCSYFQSKFERKTQLNNQSQKFYPTGGKLTGSQGYGGYEKNNQKPRHFPNNQQNMYHNNNYNYNQMQMGAPQMYMQPMIPQVNQVQMSQVQDKRVEKTVDEPDYNYLANLEDDSSKRDYLGEFIFKKIESHPFTENNQMSMDTLGKITGMILGIEDVNEIIDIVKNFDHLTARIMEAWNLLNNNSSA